MIMETHPTPIVIVSGSTDPTEVVTTFDAMDAGALAVLRRPAGIGHPDHEATARDMIQIVKLMSEVKVVRRWSRMRKSFRDPVPDKHLFVAPSGTNKNCRHGRFYWWPACDRNYSRGHSQRISLRLF